MGSEDSSYNMWRILLLAFLASPALCEDNEELALDFLSKYEYLSPTIAGNHDIVEAVSEYQSRMGLEVTGELDDETITEMKKPRCGFTDKVVHGFGTSSKWPNKALTYSFENHGRDLDRGTVESTIKRAFGMWAAVSGLSFSQTSGRANLNIKFASRSHGDNSAFDGPGRVLAHAYFPTNGRIHFDEDENWSVNGARGVDLLWVAVHEIGHSLGLQHSKVRGTIMWPSYGGYSAGIKLHSDDIAGIRSLYGNGSGGGGGGGGGGGSCSDKNRSCASWKGRGYCTGRYANYMKQNCPKSCGVCR